jgi:predicted RND superfamily exporter protein
VLGLFDTLRQRSLAARFQQGPSGKPNLGLSPEPGATILRFRLHPTQESSELAYSIRLQRFLEKTAEALRQRYPKDLGAAQVTFEGRHLEIAALASRLEIDALRSLVVLTLCLFLLLVLAFRKLETIFFIGLPPLIGLIWTLGLVALFLDTLSLLSGVFAVLLLALGLEYALQIYHRFI